MITRKEHLDEFCKETGQNVVKYIMKSCKDYGLNGKETLAVAGLIVINSKNSLKKTFKHFGFDYDEIMKGLDNET